MFEKFKEKDDVKVAAAVLLFDIIKADSEVSKEEVEKFHNIFTSQFDISKEKSESLYRQVEDLHGQFDMYLKQIKEKFESDLMAKANLMKILNEMILVDGIDDIEYDRFEIIKNELI